MMRGTMCSAVLAHVLNMVWIVWSSAPYSQIRTLTEMLSNKFPRNDALVHVQQVFRFLFDS